MRMTIDDFEEYAKSHNILTMTSEFYENRLKADMVAMLEDLKEQLREMHEDFFETEHFDEAYGVSDSMDVIQEKINDLAVSSGLDKNSKKLEKDFGELDCINRTELLKAMDTWDKFGYTETGCFVREPKGDYVPYVHYEDMLNCIKGMTSVTPQEPKTGHCRDCKWWKDSDGEYRRGCGAESQCPINRREVYEGNGYCYMYEPHESEDKE